MVRILHRFSRHKFRWKWLFDRRKSYFIGIIVLSLCSFLYFTFLRDQNHHKKHVSELYRTPRPVNYSPIPDYICPHSAKNSNSERPRNDDFQKESFKTDPRILVLSETLYSPVGKQIRNVLDYLKYSYRVQVLGKSLPLLTTLHKGRFALVIFENYYRYLNMDKWNRQLLDKYCKDYQVGLIGFLLSRKDKQFERAAVLGFPLHIRQWQQASPLMFPISSRIARIAKTGVSLPNNESQNQRAFLTFEFTHKTYECVLGAVNKCVAVLDIGKIDGINRLIFGHDLSLWPFVLSLLDALSHLSRGLFTLPLLRLLQIDIDDIFVAPTGHRMVKEDVLALIEAQSRLRKLVPDFEFQLGFSGKYYQRGTRQENEADQLLIDMSDRFNWFCHTWAHSQAHILPPLLIYNEITLNHAFAKTHSLPMKWPYAVSPHHSGVYPVHEPLYKAWNDTWGIRVTSTEEYPHLRPSSARRAFVHRNVMVLPRQTCGLYTHTISLDTINGGAEYMLEMAQGGELFNTIIFNPFLMFMTHSTNYAVDRLAPVLFNNAIKYAQCWTNLEFASVSPIKMAQSYFKSYPDETLPIWGNPCVDKRHLKIWSSDKNCAQFPKLLILGPQKTGTTALHSFLSVHPDLNASFPSPQTFEEVQFFSSNKNYNKGIDWYMSLFPVSSMSNDSNSGVLFEKSGTYFDSERAPERVKALIPHARLIIVLIDPIDRAYSWYQHQKAHGDRIATSHSFDDVISVTSSDLIGLSRLSGGVWKLRQRCITPGYYSKHIDKWAEYFSNKQILLLDGEQFKSNPASILDQVQSFMALPIYIDYSKIIRFDTNKGFFCWISSEHSGKHRSKCLGKGKGRVYEAMNNETRMKLRQIYRPHNVALQRILNKYAYSIPHWLEEDLKINFN